GDDHQTISSNSSKLYPSDDENNNRIFEPKAILLNIFDGLSVLGALIYLILTIQEFSYQ
ncbi:unnamed protein product, partial [Rotaria socialis]